MSGNSSFRSARTSPIDRCGAAAVDVALPNSGISPFGAMEEHQFEHTDLQFVTVGEGSLVDAGAVQVRAVEGTGVAHDVVAPLVAAQLGVTARDRDVVEEDVAVGMATRR